MARYPSANWLANPERVVGVYGTVPPSSWDGERYAIINDGAHTSSGTLLRSFTMFDTALLPPDADLGAFMIQDGDVAAFELNNHSVFDSTAGFGNFIDAVLVVYIDGIEIWRKSVLEVGKSQFTSTHLSAEATVEISAQIIFGDPDYPLQDGIYTGLDLDITPLGLSPGGAGFWTDFVACEET